MPETGDSSLTGADNRLAVVPVQSMNEQERLEWISNRWEEALSNLASEDDNQDYEDLERNYAALLQHYEQLRAAQEESEHQMHMRIRSGYDKTIADSWRAHAAKIEAERDAAKAERDKAQAALIDSALIQAKLLEERDEARAEVEHLRRWLNETRAEAEAWRATAKDKGYSSREVAKERDEARAEAERLLVVGKSLCNEARAWLDGPVTMYGDAVLRDAIDLWERAVKR